ncbi:MAG TPA: hypothetical protein VHU91_00635 [Mycobacteriales bacterium]|jgi:hypothetical protein|nr:hypothetical protein [Mycobacteriales bacterium]
MTKVPGTTRALEITKTLVTIRARVTKVPGTTRALEITKTLVTIRIVAALADRPLTTEGPAKTAKTAAPGRPKPVDRPPR